MTANILILFLTFFLSVPLLYAATDENKADNQFLIPHIESKYDAENTTTTHTTRSGRFLNAEENTEVKDVSNSNATTNSELEIGKKDITTRYDIYKDMNSWRGFILEKLASFGLFSDSFFTVLRGSVTEGIKPPTLSLIAVTEVGETTAHIVWSSSLPGFSRVYYSSSTPLILQAETPSVTSWGMTSHDLELTELEPETQYFYRIVSFSVSGTATTSPEFSFITTKHTK